MRLELPDTILKDSGLTEAQLRLELACALFDSEKLQLWPAAQLAGIDRQTFEAELLARGIAVYRFEVEDMKDEIDRIMAESRVGAHR
jgi:predicted HTH domain antitoxin